MRLSHTAALALHTIMALPAALAATPYLEIQASADIAQQLGGLPAGHNAVLTEAGGNLSQFPLNGVPAAADIDGFALNSDGTALLSLDIGAVLPGPLTVRHNDIVAHDGVGWWMVFDGIAAGVPQGVDIDAISHAAGDLIVSFDTTFSLGGNTFADEDLVRVDGSTLSMFFDASSAGIAGSADADAAHVLPNGHLLLSFDTGGAVDGVNYDHAHVLEYDPVADHWELAYQTYLLPGWLAADLNAFAATTDTDGDAIVDHRDNCVGSANAGQRDTDDDGFGNLCDADLNDDCIVNATDLGILKSQFFSSNANADFNGDGAVNVIDLGILRTLFYAPPGPTAFANGCN